jgi:hypothetical protein
MKETGLKQIKVVSFNGTVVHELQATGQKINVDVSGWQKGVYLIEISAGKRVMLKEKIFVNK